MSRLAPRDRRESQDRLVLPVQPARRVRQDLRDRREYKARQVPRGNPEDPA